MQEEPGGFELVLKKRLPAFHVECFGSALVDQGRFSRFAAATPAMPEAHYADGLWTAPMLWVAHAAEELGQQKAHWVIARIQSSLKELEKCVSGMRLRDRPERIAGRMCEFHSLLAPSLAVLTLLHEMYEKRFDQLLQERRFSVDDQFAWRHAFSYPVELTETMREREAFLKLADQVRHKVMSARMRSRLRAHAKQYSYLGRLRDHGTPMTVRDILGRMDHIEGEPKEVLRAWKAERDELHKRSLVFMNRMGLTARERTIVQAFQALSYWQYRKDELYAQYEQTSMRLRQKLARRLGVDETLVFWLTPSELIYRLENTREPFDVAMVENRQKHGVIAQFAEGASVVMVV